MEVETVAEDVDVEVDGMGSVAVLVDAFLAFLASFALFLRTSILFLRVSISSSSVGFRRMTSAMSNGF